MKTIVITGASDGMGTKMARQQALATLKHEVKPH